MRKRHGVCIRCGAYFSDGEQPYICNSCKSLEPAPKKYVCMNCGKIYQEKNLPSYGHTDGCCTTGSLIEVDK